MKLINDKNAVLDAIKMYDEIGRNKFFEKYELKESSINQFTYFIVIDNHKYECKPIFLAAFHNEFGSIYRGTTKGVEKNIRPNLEQLGFTIIGKDGKERQTTYKPKTSENEETNHPEDNKVSRDIKERRGQSEFRKQLIRKYNSKCVITDCELLSVLEAAHIVPHSIETNYSTDNGLLLRSDLHTLFDLNLILINENGTLEIKSSLIGTEYEQYDNQKLYCDVTTGLKANLKSRFETVVGE